MWWVGIAAAAAVVVSPFDGFDQAAPRVGERAPEVVLKSAAGAEVRLFDALKRGLVALVFGSFT